MNNNRRGLLLLLVLVIVAALVYAIKNQRNNTGSFDSRPQQANMETTPGAGARDVSPEDQSTRLHLGDIKIDLDLR